VIGLEVCLRKYLSHVVHKPWLTQSVFVIVTDTVTRVHVPVSLVVGLRLHREVGKGH